MALLKVVPTLNAVDAMLALGEALEGRGTVFFSDRPYTDPVEVDGAAALWVETSGSTGSPKLIQLSAAALLASAKASLKALGGPGQWLLCLPINYIAGAQVLVRSLVADIQPVLTNTSMPFTPEGFARAASLMTGKRKYTSLVPTQLSRLAEAAGRDDFVLEQLRRFDAILVGGQAPQESQIALLKAIGVNVIVTYGSTETSGGCVYDGIALDGVGIGISNEGRVLISGATLANGIDGEWVSEDLGHLDDNGRLVIDGRADRVINSGGVKLALDRVEQWVLSHRGVEDAVAIAIGHPEFGESFVCYVVYEDPTSGYGIDREAATEEFGLAAKHAIWASIDEMPLLSSGKPDLQVLTKHFLDFQEEMRNGQQEDEEG